MLAQVCGCGCPSRWYLTLPYNQQAVGEPRGIFEHKHSVAFKCKSRRWQRIGPGNLSGATTKHIKIQMHAQTTTDTYTHTRIDTEIQRELHLQIHMRIYTRIIECVCEGLGFHQMMWLCMWTWPKGVVQNVNYISGFLRAKPVQIQYLCRGIEQRTIFK